MLKYDEKLSFERRFEPQTTVLSEERAEKIKEDVSELQYWYTRNNNDARDIYIKLWTEILNEELYHYSYTRIFYEWKLNPDKLITHKSKRFSLPSKSMVRNNYNIEHMDYIYSASSAMREYQQFDWDLIRILASTIPEVDPKKMLGDKTFQYFRTISEYGNDKLPGMNALLKNTLNLLIQKLYLVMNLKK